MFKNNEVEQLKREQENRVNDVALQASFLLSGVRDACSKLRHPEGYDGYSVVLEAWDQGCVELHEFLVDIAKIVHAVIQAVRPVLDAADESFPGVFEYEVTEGVGNDIAKAILAGTNGYEPLRLVAWRMLYFRACDFFKTGLEGVSVNSDVGTRCCAAIETVTGQFASEPTPVSKHSELQSELDWVKSVLAEFGYDGPLAEACCPLREMLAQEGSILVPDFRFKVGDTVYHRVGTSVAKRVISEIMFDARLHESAQHALQSMTNLSYRLADIGGVYHSEDLFDSAEVAFAAIDGLTAAGHKP